MMETRNGNSKFNKPVKNDEFFPSFFPPSFYDYYRKRENIFDEINIENLRRNACNHAYYLFILASLQLQSLFISDEIDA